MADDRASRDEQAPPKIRLTKNGKSASNGNGNGTANGKESTTHLDLTADKPAGPDEGSKKSTTHLDLTEEKPSAAGESPTKKSTTHIDLTESETVPAVNEAKDATTHIDLSQAAVKKPEAHPPSKTPSAPDAKSVTTHIDLTDAAEFLQSGSLPEGRLSRRKSETARIDLSDTSNLNAEIGAVPEGRKLESPKAETSKVDLKDAEELTLEKQIETAKKQTMRVILSQTAGMGDIEIPEAGKKPPRTVKIKRDEDPSQAATLVDQPVPTVDKGATSRLDLPEGFEKPATQRKTIRIKRPDAAPTGAKPARTLKLARSSDEAAATLPESLQEPSVTSYSQEREPGAVFAAVALLAVLVTGVLVYLLMTQMPFGAEWPWPGKLVFHG
jgi:hypothetical protein